jgi:hypothetical protein
VNLRGALLALMAWVAAAAAASMAHGQMAQAIQPIDISALVRLLQEESGGVVTDWDAFEAAHRRYVEGHQPLHDRARAVIVATNGDQEAQRPMVMELRMAQQQLESTLFQELAPLVSGADAVAIERVAIRRDQAASLRLFQWFIEGIGLDLGEALHEALDGDDAAWLALKPEVDRYRATRRDAARRLLKEWVESERCSSNRKAEAAAIWQECAELERRMAEEQAKEQAKEPNQADPAGGQVEEPRLESSDDLQELEAILEAGQRRITEIYRACWRTTQSALSSMITQQLSMCDAILPRLGTIPALRVRRTLAASLGVPNDRSYGVEAMAVAFMRLPSIDAAGKAALRAVLDDWVSQDASLQDRLMRVRGTMLGTNSLVWDEAESQGLQAEFAELADRRDAVAEAARERLRAAVKPYADGADCDAQASDFAGRLAQSARSIARGEAALEGVDLALGPIEPDTEDEPIEFDPMDEVVGQRHKPDPALLDRCVVVFGIDEGTAASMRALAEVHTAALEALKQGPMERIMGSAQHEMLQRAAGQSLADMQAGIDAFLAERRGFAMRVHAADDEYWRALAALAGERGEALAAFMRVATVMGSADARWVSVSAPGEGNPVRAALECAAPGIDPDALIAVVAPVEPMSTTLTKESNDNRDAFAAEWIRGAPLWRNQAAVSNDERAAFYAESEARRQQLMNARKQIEQRRASMVDALEHDLGAVLGPKGPWRVRRAMAAEAAPPAFRDHQRIMPVLDRLLADPNLPGDLRVEVLGLKDDLEQPLREAEERLVAAIDALRSAMVNDTDGSRWPERAALGLAAQWAFWQRDEVERRGAERLRRAVPESVLPSARLRPIRVVERGRYES